MNATEQLRHPERTGGLHHGTGEAARSPLALADLDRLKAAVNLTAPIRTTIKDFLRRKAHPAGEVERMHDAWTKAVLLHVTLWTWPYAKDGDW